MERISGKSLTPTTLTSAVNIDGACSNTYTVSDHSDITSITINPLTESYLKNNEITVKNPDFNVNVIDLNVEQVIFNNPATIIIWGDGSKTVVKCTKDQKFSEYYGFCAAVTKHVFESNNQINHIIASAYVEKKETKKKEKTDQKKTSKKGKKHG